MMFLRTGRFRRHLALMGAMAQIHTAVAQQENAWQIDDASTAGGSRGEYIADLSPAQQAAALADGWTYTLTLRMVMHRGTLAQGMLYSLGNNRFNVALDLDASNNLSAQIGLPGSFLTVPLVSNNSMLARSYHEHQLDYDPATGLTTYLFNGVAKHTWAGDSISGTPAGRVLWGSGSSGGMDVANYHRVQFAIGGNNVVAYDAGTEGNPPIAPNPVTQGWTLFTEHPLVTKSAISPDVDAPRLFAATTLPASHITTTSARLNGRVNPDTQTTEVSFEWGTTPEYGQTTPAVILDGTGTDQNITFSLTGLTPGLEYYYRVTATNPLGTRSGTEARFFAGAAFEPVSLTGLPEVEAGSMVWGDYDNDGRLDFLLTGNYDNLAPETQLWRNTTNGFVNVTHAAAPGLPKVRGKAAWADYNNDGWLDFVISGSINWGNFQPITQIWKNTGGQFVEESPKVVSGLPMMLQPADLEWGDYDNDGRLDLLLMGTGSSASQVLFQIWRNTPAGFVNVTAGLSTAFPSGVSSGNAAWGDYDKDGRLDLFLTGFTPEASRMSRIWRNTGSGFVDVTAAVAPGLPQLQHSAVAWGDYDGDGWLDFAIAGDINGNIFTSVCQIWRNTGTGFSNETASVAADFRPMRDGALAWGDYDNDGRLDLLLAGQNAGLTVARYNGTRFDNIRYQGLGQQTVPLIDAAVAWGDYNNDGRLDILYSGSTGAENLTGLIRNLHAVPNSLPSAPTGLAMTSAGNAVMLSWDEATDEETPSTALSYNVRVGLSPGASNLVAFQAAADGFRRAPTMGNAQLRRTFPLTGLANGQTVYWSVQAIDGSLAGGPFSEQSSVVSFPQMHIRTENANAIISWDPPTWGWPLQESEELEVWEQVSPGDANPFIIPLTDSARFYRLIRP